MPREGERKGSLGQGQVGRYNYIEQLKTAAAKKKTKEKPPE